VVELGMKVKTMGSTTLDREDLLKSAEPDNGYYIQNFAVVANHEINLNIDPAPDLVVDVDITEKLGLKPRPCRATLMLDLRRGRVFNHVKNLAA
jgi:hypothetical protein